MVEMTVPGRLMWRDGRFERERRVVNVLSGEEHDRALAMRAMSRPVSAVTGRPEPTFEERAALGRYIGRYLKQNVLGSMAYSEREQGLSPKEWHPSQGGEGVPSYLHLSNIHMRDPYESELSYFRENKHVAGMATSDNRVILNPYSDLSPEEKQAVALNEKARVFMRVSGVRPDFSLTDEQRAAFSGYGSEQDIRETIVGRIISGDPSAADVTDEQRKWVEGVFNPKASIEDVVNY